MNSDSKDIYLSIFDCSILISTSSQHLQDIVSKIYGAFIIELLIESPSLKYSLEMDSDSTIQIKRVGESQGLYTDDVSEFIFLLEKDMTIELQKLRSDLFFLHSAALNYQGAGILLVAPSGSGKSTTAWAMINSGFDYLSDELAPIDLNSMAIAPYPHALNLKADPPVFKLPEETLYTRHTIHVPIKEPSKNTATPLRAIFYLEFNNKISEPEITPISKAEATACLYANSLNILAHGENDSGLNVAIKVARHAKNYKLKSNDLEKTCKEVKLLMEALNL